MNKDVVVGALAYYSLGYGISYGSPSNSFMGLADFFVDSHNEEDQTSTGFLGVQMDVPWPAFF